MDGDEGVPCPACPNSETGSCQLVRWRVRVGAAVRSGQVVAECREKPNELVRVRTHVAGNVKRLHFKQGDTLRPGDIMLDVEKCTHPTVMKDLCADCGMDLRSDEDPQVNIASVPMVHSVPELKVSEQLAKELGKKDSDRLLKDRKLVLLVDLDQTLIHTTNDMVPPNLKDVYHFQLRSWGPGGGGRWYHTRLRPGTQKFLKAISAIYELHICTFGARAYAHKVAELLDPHGELFSHRILSRDECFDIHTKTPNLRALFPCGDNLVCIIDDREDVWNRASNLIQVKPYHFFEHTGDINAPPGLGKTERDIEGQGVNLEDVQNKKDKADTPDSDVKSDELPALDGDSSNASKSMHVEVTVIEVGEKGDRRIEDPNIEISISMEIDEEKKPKSEEKIDPEEEENVTNLNTEEEKNMEKEKKVEPDLSSEKDGTKEKDSTEASTECDSTTVTPPSDENVIPQNTQSKWKTTEDGLIDVEDGDDYLFYLEEILQRIHKSFYDKYDTMDAGSVPDLKIVIPGVKSKVLAGTSLVFSGLVPTHQKLEHSRAYMVAQSLGAEVTQDFTDRTTHLVAVRPGTAKVHACRKASTNNKKAIPRTVTPAWLWCCAERWEHVEEMLFPLRGDASRHPRRPPPHCGSPPRISPVVITTRRRTPSGRFMDTINPLLSFSSDDIADMDKEVEDMINESDESDSENKTMSKNGNAKEKRLSEEFPETFEKNVIEDDLKNISSDSESIESLSGDYPQTKSPDKSRKRRRSNSPFTIEDCDDSESLPKQSRGKTSLIKDELELQNESAVDEISSEKSKKDGILASDGPDQNDSDSNGSADAPDDMDDGEWNIMGAALEREFLGLDE